MLYDVAINEENYMKRKTLKDEECMSGTGWVSEESQIECPYCGQEKDVIHRVRYLKCHNCNRTFEMQYGQQLLMRAIEKE